MPNGDISQINDAFAVQRQGKEAGLMDAPGGNDYSQWMRTEESRNRLTTNGIIRERLMRAINDLQGSKQQILRLGQATDLELMNQDPNYNVNSNLYVEMRKAFSSEVIGDMTPDELQKRISEMLLYTEEPVSSVNILGDINGAGLTITAPEPEPEAEEETLVEISGWSPQEVTRRFQAKPLEPDNGTVEEDQDGTP